jgi:hypothetical protein
MLFDSKGVCPSKESAVHWQLKASERSKAANPFNTEEKQKKEVKVKEDKVKTVWRSPSLRRWTRYLRKAVLCVWRQ